MMKANQVQHQQIDDRTELTVLSKYFRQFLHKACQLIVQSRSAIKNYTPCCPHPNCNDWFNLSVKDCLNVANLFNVVFWNDVQLANQDYVFRISICYEFGQDKMPLESWMIGWECEGRDSEADLLFGVYQQLATLLRGLIVHTRSLPVHRQSCSSKSKKLSYQFCVDNVLDKVDRGFRRVEIGHCKTPFGLVSVLVDYRLALPDFDSGSATNAGTQSADYVHNNVIGSDTATSGINGIVQDCVESCGDDGLPTCTPALVSNHDQVPANVDERAQQVKKLLNSDSRLVRGSSSAIISGRLDASSNGKQASLSRRIATNAFDSVDLTNKSITSTDGALLYSPILQWADLIEPETRTRNSRQSDQVRLYNYCSRNVDLLLLDDSSNRNKQRSERTTLGAFLDSNFTFESHYNQMKEIRNLNELIGCYDNEARDDNCDEKQWRMRDTSG